MARNVCDKQLLTKAILQKIFQGVIIVIFFSFLKEYFLIYKYISYPDDVHEEH